MTRKILFLFALLMLSEHLMVLYREQIMLPNLLGRFELQKDILHGTALSPYRYRVMIPFLTEGLASVLRFIMSSVEDLDRFKKADYAISYFSFFAFLATSFWMIARKHESFWAGIASMFMGAVICSRTFSDQGYQPWSYLEPVFLSLLLIALSAKKPVWCAVILSISVFNRETSVLWSLLFLPEILGSDRKKWLAVPVSGLVFYLALRGIRGNAPQFDSLAWVRETNRREQGAQDALNRYMGWLFFPFLIGWLKSLKQRERRLRYALFAPAYLFVMFVFARYRELPRILMGVYPLLSLEIFSLGEPASSNSAKPI